VFRFRPGILHRYVFLELLSPFLVSLFVFTGILFLTRSLKLLELVVNKNVSVIDILSLFAYIIPQFLELAIPMSLLLAAILGFGRLSADSELIVMRASGIGIRSLLRPVLIFTAIFFTISLLLGCYIRPWANDRLNGKMFEMAQLKASSGLIAGVFNEFGPLTMYAETVDSKSGQLGDVIISDRRNPDNSRTFIAKHGLLLSDPESRVVYLRLFDGSIHEGGGLNYNVTYFDINAISLEPTDLLSDVDAREGKKANEMVIGELVSAVQAARDGRYTLKRGVKKDDVQETTERLLVRKSRLEVELHRRFALPISCFIVVILGMALGIQPARGSKSWVTAVNITMGIGIITLYYFATAFATALGQQAVVPPSLIMWMPNILFALAAYFIFRKIESEEWMAVSQAMSQAIVSFFMRIRSRISPDEEVSA
jgi:lipopolysaccharide export system permease protein